MIVTIIKELQDMIKTKSVTLIGQAVNKNQSSLSGYVMLAVMQVDKTLNRTGLVWGGDHFDTVDSAKLNILALSDKHYDSTGHYFSWGNI